MEWLLNTIAPDYRGRMLHKGVDYSDGCKRLKRDQVPGRLVELPQQAAQVNERLIR
jgi:hypothetical protein